MKHNSSLWLATLAQHTRSNMEQAKQWLMLPEEVLQQRPAPGKWNALECIEHLNRYGDFYMPEFRNRIETTKFSSPQDWFKQGWLGGYFTKSMEPKARLNRMKTFKAMDPANARLTKTVISKFVQQQAELLDIIDRAKLVDINKTRTSISITSLITLKLGDALAFFTAHNNRHMQQAERALAIKSSAADMAIGG